MFFKYINLLETKRCGMFLEREAVLCHRQCSPTFQDHQLSRPQTQRQCLGARQATQASIPEKNTWMLHQNLSCPTLINYPPVNIPKKWKLMGIPLENVTLLEGIIMYHLYHPRSPPYSTGLKEAFMMFQHAPAVWCVSPLPGLMEESFLPSCTAAK